MSPATTTVAGLARNLGARSVLVVTAAAGRRARDSTRTDADPDIEIVEVGTTAQLTRRFELAWVDTSVLTAAPEARRAGIHQAVQHLGPGGWIVLDHVADAELRRTCTEFELAVDEACSTPSVLVCRRTFRTTVHDLLFEARSMINRVDARSLSLLLDSDEPPLVVDTRTHVDRARTGVIQGSIHAPRTVLEWHLDPANGYRHPAVRSLQQPLVVVCNRGYSSSLAAANLLRIGFTNVADLIGGVHAWCAAGLPTVAPDHSHLDV